jgi:tetratricopeptide (TPR) repeat protein
MIKNVLLAFLISFTCAAAEDSNVLYARALELFEIRYLDKANAEKAKEIAEEILVKEPENVNVRVLISRYYFFSGEGLAKDDDKRAVYEKGIEWAKKALKLDEKNADAHFYYAASLGRCAQLKGIFNAMGSAGEIKKEFERTLELDPKHPIAKVALANYYYQVPGLFGGSTEKAIELLKEAIAADPPVSMPYIDLAIIYRNQGKKKEAIELLNTVINMKNPNLPANYYLYDKKDTEKLLKDMQ